MVSKTPLVRYKTWWKSHSLAWRISHAARWWWRRFLAGLTSRPGPGFELAAQIGMLSPDPHVIEAACDSSLESPCQKSKRGVVAWHRKLGVVARGHNTPVAGECNGSDHCRKTCAKRCQHAEMAAVLEVLAQRRPYPVELVHVKTVDGTLVAGGPPSCWQCSRLLSSQPVPPFVTHIWLFQTPGVWHRYPVKRFHELTLESCRLTAPEPEAATAGPATVPEGP
jgi:hypothetical protein